MHSVYGAFFKMLVVIAIRSLIPLGAATIFLLSTQPEAITEVPDQSGAGIGRIMIILCGIVFLFWAVWPWRKAWGRFPWCFITSFLAAVGAGGLLMAVSPDYAVSIFFALMMLAGSYIVLAAEMILTRPRLLPPGAPWPPTSSGRTNRPTPPGWQ